MARGCDTGVRIALARRRAARAVRRVCSTPQATLSVRTRVGGGDRQERRAADPVVREGRRAHHDVDRRARPASSPARRRDGGGVLVARAPASPRPGGRRRPSPACSSDRPSHRSRQPRQAAERKRSRTGAAASTTSIRHASAVGRDADDVVGRVRGVVRCRSGWGGAGAGCRPAARSRHLRRRARLLELLVGDLDDAAPVAAPAAHHLVDVAGEHLLVLDHEVAAHACSGGRPSSVCETVTSKRVRLPQPSQRYRGSAHPHHGSRPRPRRRLSVGLRSLAERPRRPATPVIVTPVPCRRPTGGAAARACSSVSKTAIDVPWRSSRRTQ